MSSLLSVPVQPTNVSGYYLYSEWAGLKPDRQKWAGKLLKMAENDMGSSEVAIFIRRLFTELPQS